MEIRFTVTRPAPIGAAAGPVPSRLQLPPVSGDRTAGYGRLRAPAPSLADTPAVPGTPTAQEYH